MKIKVHMTAFAEPGTIRMVELPHYTNLDDQGAERFLDIVYYYGQNDFQPQDCCSVSGGDVIELDDGRLFIIQLPAGYKEITKEQFEEHKKLDRRERQFSKLVSAY